MLVLKGNDITSLAESPGLDFLKMDMKNDVGETATPPVFGTPLRTSTPSGGAATGSGDGDGHSLHSVRNLLSPIRISKTVHSVHCVKTTESSSQSSAQQKSPQQAEQPLPRSLDSFLSGFEKDSSPSKKITGENHSLLQHEHELMTEKLSGMDENEVKTLLTKVLIENVGLRQELRTKERRITAYKGQMLAVLDWKVRQEADENETDEDKPHDRSFSCDLHRLDKFKKRDSWLLSTESRPSSQEETSSLPRFSSSSEIDESGMIEAGEIPRLRKCSRSSSAPLNSNSSSQEIRVVEEVYGIRQSLSFIQGLASSIDVDQEELRHKIKDGCYLTNQLLLGGASGWICALFVKKFGKLALSAVGGGVLLLMYTSKKGYVNVNYDSIYDELSRLCDSDMDDDILGNGTEDYEDLLNRLNLGNVQNEDDSENNTDKVEKRKSNKVDQLGQSCWSVDRLKRAKKWIRSHTYTVGGFLLGFVYNLI